MLVRKSATVLPRFLPGAKKVGLAGRLNTQRTIDNSRTGEIAQAEANSEVLDIKDCGTNTGVSGLALGLTIPGQKGSYWSARVDVSCYLPHGPSDKDATNAIDRATSIVSAALEKEAAEVQSFFADK